MLNLLYATLVPLIIILFSLFCIGTISIVLFFTIFNLSTYLYHTICEFIERKNE